MRYRTFIRLASTLAAVIVCCAVSTDRAAATRLNSLWSAKSHQLSGRFDNKWQKNYNAIRLPHGWLFARNDQKYLYLLVDLTGDTVADRRRNQPPWGDGISISFDVDRNRKVTPNTDVYFALLRGKYQVGRKLFTAPGRWTAFRRSKAKVKTAFSGSPVQRRNHMIWELAIPLKEISAKAGKPVFLGIQTKSVTPGFNDKFPGNHWNDFSNLIEVQLAAPFQMVTMTVINPQSLRQFIRRQPRQVIVRPILRPVDGAAPGSQPPCDLPEGKPVRRTILPDGTVELHYADGSKKQHISGTWKYFCPDGTPVPTQVLMSHIQPTFPPTLPDQATQAWLEFHNNRLLGIISTIVNDEQMIDDYLNSETVSGDVTVYQQIWGRSNTIDNLLVE